jgi:hypothetical protein
VFHFSFPVFGGYFRYAVLAHRTLLGNSIASVLPELLVKVSGMASFGQVTLAQKGGDRVVHLLACVPETRGMEMQVVEELIAVSDVVSCCGTMATRFLKSFMAHSALSCP